MAEDTDVTIEVKALSTGEARPELPPALIDIGHHELTISLEDRPVMKLKDTGKIGPAGGMGDRGPRTWITGQSSGITCDPLDKIPRATVRMPPNYPSSLRTDLIEGVVMMEFVVDVKGRVVSAMMRESTHREFADWHCAPC